MKSAGETSNKYGIGQFACKLLSARIAVRINCKIIIRHIIHDCRNAVFQRKL